MEGTGFTGQADGAGHGLRLVELPASGTGGGPGFDFERLLGRLIADRSYKGQIAAAVTRPGRPARFGTLDRPLPEALSDALAGLGIERLYSHQAAAIEAVRNGRNVTVVTGTASGKTLSYTLPVLERLLEDREATALCLFPTKALAQDQLKSLTRLAGLVPGAMEILCPGVYDGDTSQSARRRLRDGSRIILSNPDMLHRAILPYHGRWSRFLENLRFVVVDEIHAYRGIFGSNVGNVLRRLRRVAAHHGGEPRFLNSSATIRNPGELAEKLTGLATDSVTEDGSPRGPRTFVTWNPPFLDDAKVVRKSSNVEAMEILVRLVREGVQTIVFARARVVAELIYKYAHDELQATEGHLAEKLSPYRAGYLPSDRRAIEKRLFSGELMGVVSTSALELGIDIGSLDASILVGFPGTIASVRQQSGRAGRGSHPSLTIFVAYSDPIDQYLVRHPDYLMESSPEAAVIDPENPHILAGHLACAAFELPLTEADQALFGPGAAPVIEALAQHGSLRGLGSELYWGSSEFPAQTVNLRTISADTFSIVDRRSGAVIGTVDATSAPELVYPEAIYLHEGDTWLVTRLDLEKKVASVEPVSVDYYTQPILDSSIRLSRTLEESRPGGERLTLNQVTVTWATTMMKKIQFGSTDSIGYKNLNLPPQHLDTVALGWTPSPALREELRRQGFRPSEALAGVRNVMITVLPLFAMCDRSNVGGVIDSSNTGAATLFLYDRFPGGLGFSARGYDCWADLVEESWKLVSECPCASGCPSCVGLPVLIPAQHQDPDVMNGFPIPDKNATLALLAILRSDGSGPF